MFPSDREVDVAMFDIVVTDEVTASVVSDILWSSGVLAVEEISVPNRIRLRSSFGVDARQTADRLDALFGQGRDLFDADIPRSAVIDWAVSLVDPTVADSWRDFALPVEITPSLRVVPAWLFDEKDQPVSPEMTHLLIDPGATFGMGDHPTTRGTLCLLEKWVQPQAAVLDVGCGSGILGIAALRLGATSAHGIDINPASVKVSVENAIRNSVHDRWTVSLDPLQIVNGPFDVVVANILAPVLIDLAEDLKRVLHPRGVLVISGILEGRFDHVLEVLRPLHVVETLNVDGWTTIAMIH